MTTKRMRSSLSIKQVRGQACDAGAPTKRMTDPEAPEKSFVRIKLKKSSFKKRKSSKMRVKFEQVPAKDRDALLEKLEENCLKHQEEMNKLVSPLAASEADATIEHSSEAKDLNPDDDVIGYLEPMETEAEEEIWREFKVSDKKKIYAPSMNPDSLIQAKQRVIKRDQPIAGLLANFAVDIFNKICAKFGLSCCLRMIEILDVKYIRFHPLYYVFYIELVAKEEGKGHIYEAVVATEWVSGRKTLVGFCRPYVYSKKKNAYVPKYGSKTMKGKKETKEPKSMHEARTGKKETKEPECMDEDLPEHLGLGRGYVGGYYYRITLSEFHPMNFPF